MALAELQAFLTRYFRDPTFRTHYRNGERAALEAEAGLSTDDVDLIHQLDLADLDRGAKDIRRERLSKRFAEFQPFVAHLSLFCSLDEFGSAFDAACCRGLEARPMELDRFLDFASRYVVNHGLPAYLLDLLRFSHVTSELSGMPREQPDGALDDVTTDIRAWHRIRLRRPLRVVCFGCDVVAVASSPPQDLASWPVEPTKVLIQKSWSLFNRAEARNVSDLPLVEPLIEHSELTLLDLLAGLPTTQFEPAVARLVELFRAGVIHIIQPRHFRDNVV